ncbi:MAG: Gfo/Idh/MocA family oxidoreductase [Bacteroidales bacterium]|nr:Gfo/Idh/MocA family oxidoreductase [Bacteroidales bacterium]
MKVYNWGIIGLGFIAAKFAEGLSCLPNAKLFAVASRNKKKAENFAARYHVPHAYGSYKEIVENKQIDIIYIATPHTLHCENTLMCLENKIPVLCEKPFAINLTEVKKMVTKAGEMKTLLMEAMWTAYLPSVKRIKETIASGIIGDIELIRADFGFKADKNPEGRLFNPELGGGSLLDVGIYPAYLALEFLGVPDQVKALASFGHTGVDENCAFIFKYPHGQLASLYSSIIAKTSIDAMITGTDGGIYLHSDFFMPARISLIKDGTDTEITPKYKGNGYNYEAEEAMKCLSEGKTESELMKHHKSLQLIETLDRIRKECGIRYPKHDD